MKRAIIVSASTLAGLGAILALNPDPTTSSVALEQPTAGVSSGSTDTGSADTGSSSSYTGSAVQVRNFGTIQVEVTTSAGQITDISALQVPEWDQKSSMISSYSVPVLVSQALEAQSADVAGVSGATYTSMGFAQSLQAALAKGGLG